MPATLPGREASANLARLEENFIERFGTYTSLHYQDRSYTNVEELEYARMLAGILKDHGVASGDRVLIMLPNSPELTALLQAVWTIGAVAVPIMPQWTTVEAGYALRHSGATVAITLPALAPRLHDAAKQAGAVRHLLAFGETGVEGSENVVPQLKGASPVATPVDRSPSDLALLLYTSGTTGPPKGVMLSHGNISAALDSAVRRNPNMPRGPILQALPFSHSFGLGILYLAKASGFASILLPQFDPVQVFRAIEQHQVQYLPAVPTMLVHLLQHPEGQRYDLSSLRRVISGGAALPEHVRVACAQRWGCRVEQGYGLSETLAVATLYDEMTPYRPGSVGPPVPGVEIRIVDTDDRPLPARQIGEIWLTGSHVTQGYWNDPDATRDAFADKWFRTGDIGYLDEDGFLYITDRKKDLIIKGGENISPREIEEVLYAHRAVAEAAVIGIPDPVYGEEICAFVQLKPGAVADEAEIRNHVGAFVNRFKVPARVIFHTALPKNVIGKISKREIRDRFTGPLTQSSTPSTSPGS
ncbi:MAG TPA: AMP-binding protein [Bryobacteraceae bacterium]|nr:AMP-binding protein [Bryobacteraceae bacterium]